jgi:hypothetical protein
MQRAILYYLSFVLLYVAIFGLLLIPLTVYGLFGPLEEDASIWEMLTASAGPLQMKLTALAYLFINFPLGLPNLLWYFNGGLVPLFVVLDALLVGWVLRRVLVKRRAQQYATGVNAGLLVVLLGYLLLGGLAG